MTVLNEVRTIFALTIAVIAVASPAQGATYQVDPGGGGDFTTIQAALDACASGDVIELADGTYAGPGNRDLDYLGKELIVRSQSGNATGCVIDCGGTPAEPHRGIEFATGEGSGAILEAVTITGGYVSGTAPDGSGGAIRCRNASSPTLRECIFSGNSAETHGGAFACYDGCWPTIVGCEFQANSV